MKFNVSIGILVLITAACSTTASVCGPDAGENLQIASAQAYKKAVDWLMSQQNKRYGWDRVTPRVVMSLQASQDNQWITDEDLVSQLTVKEMEIELLAALSNKPCENSRSPRDPLSAGRLAYPIMALHSACRDVTDFHEHDLINLINHKIRKFPEGDFNHFFQYGFAVMALCTTGSEISQDYIDEIRNGQNDDGGFTLGTDVTAVVVMALSCVRDKTDLFVDDILQRAVEKLISTQQADGSFGNINTNALVAQALSAAGADPTNWRCSDVMQLILAEQDTSGAFGRPVLTTMQVLPSLNGANFGQIDNSACPVEEVVEPTDVASDGQLISMSLTVINNQESGRLGSYQTSIVKGTNLYNAMLKIEEETSFVFEAAESAWGHSIEMIFGVWADPQNEMFWAIYNYSEPLQTGVDGYIPRNGDNIYFRYTSYSDFHH